MEIKGRAFSLLPKAVFLAEPQRAQGVTTAQHTLMGGPGPGYASAPQAGQGLLSSVLRSGHIRCINMCHVHISLRRSGILNAQNVGFPCVLVNFMCQLDRVARCPESWSDRILGVSVRVFMVEVNI